VCDYLTITLGDESHESVRVLYLSSRNHLIEDEAHAVGTTDTTPFYPRQLIMRACDLRARGIIIAHNHPSGDPSPSPDDIALTQQISSLLSQIGIRLLDHIIIGRNRFFSFRQEGKLK